MIVALEHIVHTHAGYGTSANLLLREVENEEEAFAEMRRFLEVNHISSNTTYVSMVERREYSEECITPRHKEVSMYLEGCPPYNRSENKDIESVAFGIYYGSDRPRYEKLGTIEDWGLCEKRDWQTGEMRLVKDEKHSINSVVLDSGEWYNCVKRYLDDLSIRRAGGE